MSILKLIKQTLKTTILLTSITFFSVFISQPTYATSITINDLNSFANAERAGAGLAPLNLNAQLNSAALNKANHMFANNYWAHIAPDGMTPWNFIDASGYVYSTAGENLAMHYTSSSSVVAGWMASPSHKANVMNTSYSDVGYAAVDGVLLGEQTTLVVAMYGSSKSIPVAIESIVSVDSSENEVAVIEYNQDVADTVSIEVADVAKNEEAIEVSKAVSDNGVKVSVVVEENDVNSKDNTTLTVENDKKPGTVAGVMSIIPETIDNYRTLNFEIKAILFTICLLMFVAAIKFILFKLHDKSGNEYIWFQKKPVVGSTILGLVFILTTLNSIGFVL